MSHADLYAAALQAIEPVDAVWLERAQARQLRLTKPPGSLGRLEEIANRLAAIQQTLAPFVRRPRIVVFAADHGVCNEGVNPYPQAVTAQMVMNFLQGGAAINALAAVAGVELQVVDVGVANKITDGIAGDEKLIRQPVASGTKNFCMEPAMSRAEAMAAIGTGVEIAYAADAEGCTLIGIGEMGIGNTTTASAITAALTGLAAGSVVGAGTGADDACMRRKVSAVERAIALHGRHLSDPFEVLARVGGFEIGAMIGLCLGAAENRCAIVVDGFIATAAAAVAVRLCDPVRGYLFAAHRSTETGQAALLEIIGHRPLLDLGMRLGEGTGAALAIPMIRAAVEAFTHMATFESAGVSDAAHGTP